MAGASDAHVTISRNLFALLRNHVRGSGCRVYMADMKAYIETANIFYYPDVMVTCDARDRAFQNHKKYPCLIVEVLSQKTEAFDSANATLRERGDKFTDYQQLETFQEYVLISQKRQRIECFRRNAEGFWVLQSLISPSSTTSNPWWLKITGTFANSTAFEEAMQLGKEYRQSQQEDEEQRIPPPKGGIVTIK